MKFGFAGTLKNSALALTVVAVSPLMPCAVAQAQPVILWSSMSGAPRTTPGVWGNGAAARSREQSYEGAAVLKVTARNPEEGARLDVDPPVDIKPFLGENGLLRLRLRFRDAPIPVVQPPAVGEFPGVGTPGFGNFPNPLGGNTGAANPGFGTVPPPVFRPNQQLSPRLAQFNPPPLGNAGGGFPALPPAQPGGNMLPGADVFQPPVWTGPPPQETALRRILVTFMLEQGALAGYVNLNLEATIPDDNGWRLFSLPIPSMRATPGANGNLKRILLTADEEDSFYLEQMALMIETPALTVSIRRPEDPPGARVADITVRPGPLTLVADIEIGATDPIIEWNFDADNLGTLPPPAFGPAPVVLREGAAPVVVGPRIDARGAVARFDYPNEEQNYRVQVTLRDRVGKKAPVTASILVRTRG